MHRRPRMLKFIIVSIEAILPIGCFSFRDSRSHRPVIQTRGFTRKPTALFYLDDDPMTQMLSHPQVNSRVTDLTPEQHPHSRANNTLISPKLRPSHTTAWNLRYNELLQFKEENGHCMVPQKYPPNPRLGLWVMAQRRYYKLQMDGKRTGLNSHRIGLLEKIGFVFVRDNRGPRLKSYSSSLPQVEDFQYCEEIDTTDDFVQFMIEKNEQFSAEDIRKAWKIRFRMYR